MPLAVTTQGETLWLGLTRSAMVRVPHVVSSPEIAPEPQRIDATNLASDRMVYVQGIKDYAGELTWEANAQHYTSGGLRELMAMDGQEVYVERRMPLVGVRVSFEGVATIAMTSASPDAVQHVTIRVAPSSAMSVESWTPSMSDGYTVRIRTDAETHMDVVHVAVGYGGRGLTQVVSRTSRRQGAANIPHEWDFNGGTGPFGCFYGAFNIDAYTPGTESEEPICTEAGRIAYRLDPYHLKRTLGGTRLRGTYNVMLVIPTVYWRVASNDLYMSDSGSGTAYAHTADGVVYPYIGIGVYEASTDGTRLLSVPGQAPAASRTHDEFKALADEDAPAEGCDFQMWNFYQWTLFKMMAYAVMGTKNSQWSLGDGPVSNSSASTTGLADNAGPYADSTNDYDKVFLENAWGSVYGIIGDAMLSGGVLCAGQSLGGATLGGQTPTGVSVPITGGSWKAIGETSNGSATWDLVTATGTGGTADPSTSGDNVVSDSGSRTLRVGGRYNYNAPAGINFTDANGAFTLASTSIGTRLSYFINAYALGLADEAPAVSRTLAASPTRTVEAVSLERTEVSAVSRDEEAVLDATEAREASEDASEDEDVQEAVSDGEVTE